MNASKKPWQTPEWKEKRDKFIEGKCCEWCGSTESLCPHHKEQAIPYLALYGAIADYLLAQLVKNGTYKLIQKAACPKCHHFGLTKHKYLLPKYRCHTCDFTFDKPIQYPTGKISPKDFADFNLKYKDMINEEARRIKLAEKERYMNFKDVMILCKRCHMAIGKGQILCKACKKNYHDPKYDKCSQCTPITDYVLAQIRALSHYKETKSQDQSVIRDFLQEVGKSSVDTLALKDGIILVQKLSDVQIPVKMMCGKTVSMSKEDYKEAKSDHFFDCGYCIEDHKQDHCAYDEPGKDESSE